MKSQKPTAVDVAKLAGVSRSTVSMVLNQREGASFSPETVRRVMDAAKQLGYGKGKFSGAGKVSRLVVAICPTIVNSYYSDLLQAIEEAARGKGYQLMVCTTHRNPVWESEILSNIRCMGASGIIFTNCPHNLEQAELLGREIPTAIITDRTQQMSLDAVELNNYAAGGIIAEHMLELGHRNIAYLSTTLDQYNTARTRRLDGLVDTFRRECPLGRTLIKSLEVSPSDEQSNLDIEHQVGYRLAAECLNVPELTGFVAVNDMVAYGVMDAVLEAGKRIPEDYSVCGFDNLQPSRFHSISLTSVEHHIADKGHHVFEILYGKMTGTGGNSITRVEYQPKLIVRGSTGPARK